MKIKLDYGRNGIDVQIPDQYLLCTLTGCYHTPIADPYARLCNVLNAPTGTKPLSELAEGRKSACIVISDITRPVPNSIILPPILSTLEKSGIPSDAITILIATGMHRPNEGQELIELIGADIAGNYRVVNHHCECDDEQMMVGVTSTGVKAYVDREFAEADLKIVTGLIEPHFMAGYSGGRKSVCPGIVSLKVAEYFHSPELLEHTCADCGILDGNPLHQMALEISRLVGVDFCVNVVMDNERRLTGIFAGDIDAAHLEGVEFVEAQLRAEAPLPADIVVTSAGGYPLDSTFYQVVKGIVGALPVVKEGGTIIIAAEMSEGLGSSEFTELLQSMDNVPKYLEMIQQPGFFIKDQWEVEMLCKALKKANVWLASGNLDTASSCGRFVKPVTSVESGISDALEHHGPEATIAAIPSGPYVMPWCR